MKKKKLIFFLSWFSPWKLIDEREKVTLLNNMKKTKQYMQIVFDVRY